MTMIFIIASVPRLGSDMHAIMHVYVHVTWDKRILFEAYEGKSSHWDDCVPHHSATLWLCNEVGHISQRLRAVIE